MCAWMAALAGGVMSYMGAREQNQASRGAGRVDIVHENNPWRPSLEYRGDLMERAFQQINGGQPSGFNRPEPAPGQSGPVDNGSGALNPDPNGGKGPGRGGATTGARPGQRGGQNPPASQGGGRGGRGGNGGGGIRNPNQTTRGGGAYGGVSTDTSGILDQMEQRAREGNQLYGQAEDYISDTIGGDPSQDRNAYRTETAGMLRNMDDPDLRRFTNMLFEDVEGARPGQRSGGGAAPARVNYGVLNGGGGGGGGYTPEQLQWINSNGASGTPPPGATGQTSSRVGPVGVVDDLQGILAGQGAPQAVKDLISKRAKEEADKRLADLNRQFVGSNMMGSTPWQQNFVESEKQYGRELSDALTGADYGLYQHGLNLGTNYDLATLDREAQEREGAANRAQSASNAGMSAAAADAENATRMNLARLDALRDAVGMQSQQSQFRAQGMGSLADLYGQDQRYALGATPDITGLGMRDWGAAAGVSLGADQNRNSFAADRGREAVGRAGIRAESNIAQQRLNFDQYRYNREAPMSDLMRYSDILNAASAGGGYSHEWGLDQRGASPSYTNPYAQAISGAAAGYQLYNQATGR